MARLPRRIAGIGASDLPDAAAFDAYVGPAREITVDQQRGIIALHDGVTPGGQQFHAGRGGDSDTAIDPIPKSFAGIIGDNQTYTLDLVPATAGNVLVYVGGIRQVPGVDYTVSGATLTLLSNPDGLEVDTLLLAGPYSLTFIQNGSITEDKLAPALKESLENAAIAASVVAAQGWAEGTEPGGVGTKSAKEWAEEAANLSQNAATVEDLKALNPSDNPVIFLSQINREGNFYWVTGNLSAFVAADPLEAMYIASDADPTGATGAWVRRRESLDILATWCGAVADSTGVGSGTDSHQAIQAALDLAIFLGGNLNLGWGNYRLSATLVYDKTALNADSGKVPSIYGAGITQTRLYFDAAVSIGIDVQGAFVGGIFGSFFHMRDFGVFSSGKTGTGIKVKDVALADFSRIRSNGWNKGVHFQNVISIKFNHPYLDSNVYGLHAEDGPSAASCNAINIQSPWIGSNGRVGILADNPATLNIYGGSIEGNGLVTGGIDPNSSGGLIVNNPGKGGHNSVVVQGVYFEHNKGVADILIYSTLYSTSHYIHGNSFARISATDYTTYNVFVNASNFRQTLSLSGNGFGNLASGYVESSARPYVNIDDAGNVLTVVDDGSNTYEDAVAAPNFSSVHAYTEKTNAQAVGWVSSAGVLSAGSTNVLSVSKVSTGRYQINLKKGWVGPKFAVCMPNLGRTCALFTYTDTSLTVEFQTSGGAPAAADVDFGFVVYRPV